MMIMQKAVRVIYDMSEDAKIREVARLREKALHDEASALKNAKAEGIEEGMAQGMEKGRADERARMIEQLRKMGVGSDVIDRLS